MWLIGEAAALLVLSAAQGSVRLAARKAGKTRADESSLNAEAVYNSVARRGVRAPVACKPVVYAAPSPRQSIAMYQR